jgi:hypothetical protein
VRSRIIQGQAMPKRDKMEIEIAFKALAFFAAFMAGRSLTAYFKKTNSAAKRGRVTASHDAIRARALHVPRVGR